MMDIDTYEKFQDLASAGEKNNAMILQNLTNEEASLLQLLKILIGKNRLEQEKISQYFVGEQLTKLINL